MKKEIKMSIIVGAFALISVGCFFISVIFLSQWQREEAGFYLDIEFSFLNNLSARAPVKVAGGIDVGFVQSIYQKDLKTFARIYLSNKLANKIPKRAETQFAIFTEGLIGQKYININIPKQEEGDVFYKNNDTLIGLDPPSIDQLLLTFSSWFDGKNGGQVIAEILKETQTFIQTLNLIASENRQDIRLTVKEIRNIFQRVSGQVEGLITKLSLLTSNLADLSEKNKADINILLKNVAMVSRDLSIITQRINDGNGSIGKLISDPEIYNLLKAASVNANKFFKKIENKPWVLFNKN